ncbi:MAG: Tyrosine--tRNA ligase [Patescibacteria group bacterium]|nr:Tyrosine--tRNA ligase [Patescibacteria group bacterium]
MPINIDENKIEEILHRSVKEILPTREELKKELLSGKKLRIYIGTDATGSSLHLGHATNYMILEKFRELGHEVIFLIGDFTSRIGDPTDKGATRVQLTREQVIENTKTWINQVKPLIKVEDPENPVKILYNHDWLAKLTFEDVIGIASHFTVQQMMERDMFEKRLEENKPIHLHEFFYPLMQGYDSVVMDVDIEMCGNDQKFNALAGRHLQKRYNNKEKFVFITNLLENPKTGEKMMSKSLGTGIFLDWDADKMFGGIMAQPDENIYQLFVDCTFVSQDEILEMQFAMQNGENPMEFKKRLAREIVTIYHSFENAAKAQINWENTFSKGGLPDEIPEVKTENGKLLADILAEHKFVESKTEFRRLVAEGAVKIMNGEVEEKITDDKYAVSESVILKIGKRKFVKITT